MRPAPVRDRVARPTICGRLNSSVIAAPSAIRSGQKARSTPSAGDATSRSTRRVTPGNTVLRSTSSWPGLNRSASRPTIRGTASGSGLRYWSTGVPTTTTTCSARDTERGSLSQTSRPGKCVGQRLLDAGLEERRLTARDPRHRVDVDVVHAHGEPARGEGDREREADVARTADHADVVVEPPGRHWLEEWRIRAATTGCSAPCPTDGMGRRSASRRPTSTSAAAPTEEARCRSPGSGRRGAPPRTLDQPRRSTARRPNAPCWPSGWP